jgi:hypothetical protein
MAGSRMSPLQKSSRRSSELMSAVGRVADGMGCGGMR